MATVQHHHNQGTVQDLAQQMILAGYDPFRDRMQAVSSMEQVEIPPQIIDSVLELADRLAAEIALWNPGGCLPKNNGKTIYPGIENQQNIGGM